MGKYIDAAKKGFERGNKITDIRLIVSDRLRLLRAKNNYTQKEIADLANVDPTTNAGYENKISTPALYALVSIADVYQVSLDYITGRTDNVKGLYADTVDESISDNELTSRVSLLEQELNVLKEKIK